MDRDSNERTPPAGQSHLTGFVGEVGRRQVWRTSIAYAAVVFVLLQLGEILFPAFGAPDWAMRLLVVICFLGFPVAVALSWAFDITSTGIHRSQTDGLGVDATEYTGTRLPRLAFLGVVVLSVGGVGWWAIRDAMVEGADPPSAAPTDDALSPASLPDVDLQIRSLAVLPLDDFSETEGGEYFTAGFHEELISQLSQIASARVVSRTSVVQYDAAGKAMPTIAQELGVEGVVEGSVFRDGNRVRITVQLIHGRTDQHLWANSYDGTLEDAITLQRTVARAIAQEIEAEVGTGEGWQAPGARVASSPQVQEEYLKGRYNQFQTSPEALEQAVVHFEAAVEKDSTFAPAYAGLAGARLIHWLQSGDTVASHALSDPEIVEPLEIAFSLDESSPEATAVVATIQEALGKVPEMKLPRGIAVLGDSASPLKVELALTATEFGRQLHRVMVTQNVQTGRKPAGPPSRRVAQAQRLLASRDFETAEALIRSAIEEAPESVEAWDALENLKAMQNDFAAAARVRAERQSRWTDVGPEDTETGGNKEIPSMDRREYWTSRLEELRTRTEEGLPVSPVSMARAHLGLGQQDQALQELKHAVEVRDRNLVSLWSDPAWDSIRGDPRFRRILNDARQSGGESRRQPA